LIKSTRFDECMCTVISETNMAKHGKVVKVLYTFFYDRHCTKLSTTWTQFI